jgi:hypothetical protein
MTRICTRRASLAPTPTPAHSNGCGIFSASASGSTPNSPSHWRRALCRKAFTSCSGIESMGAHGGCACGASDASIRPASRRPALHSSAGPFSAWSMRSATRPRACTGMRLRLRAYLETSMSCAAKRPACTATPRLGKQAIRADYQPVRQSSQRRTVAKSKAARLASGLPGRAAPGAQGLSGRIVPERA